MIKYILSESYEKTATTTDSYVFLNLNLTPSVYMNTCVHICFMRLVYVCMCACTYLYM
jgi:hypothetical protein